MRVSNSDQETALVIGATGRHGGTGARVVERLQAAGRVVRALVRSDDERAQRLRESGVQTLVGDLHDRRTLLPALDGVDSVYIAYPVAVGIVDALANVASVIGEQGSSPHVVIMGSGAADPNSPSGIARAHALSEELLLKLGVNFTAVRVEGMRADPSQPIVPGHEIVGVIDAVGDGVNTWQVGDRVGLGYLGGHDANV